jgi:hypothetical protein
LEVLSIILRKAGRHTRRVSRLWKLVYGPLDCGIELRGISSKEDIDRVLAQDPHRFHHTTSLVLIGDEADSQPGQAAEITAAVPAAFPALRSIHLPHTVTPADLQALQPLSPTLTALILPEISPLLPHVSSMLQLTSLRSITFCCLSKDIPRVPEALEALSRLPHLQQLAHAPFNDYQDHSASLLIPSLRNLDLTHLNLDEICLSDWDSSSTDALRTAMPHLSALTLLLDFNGEPADGLPASDPCSNHSVMAALAQRAALRSLSMELVHLSQEHHNLGSLSALRLSELHVSAEGEGWDDRNDSSKLDAVLAAMAVQRSLTSLSIRPGVAAAELSQAAVQSLSTFATSLQKLHLDALVDEDGTFFDVLATMSQLKHFAFDPAAHFDPAVIDASWQQASMHLTALEVLEITTGCPHMMRAAVDHVARLTNLRELALHGAWHASLGAAMYQIVSLERSLTRLSLGSRLALMVPDLSGILTRMTGLKRLELDGHRLVEDPRLPECVLPLPPALRVLQLHGGGNLAEEFRARLRVAADMQDCSVRVGAVWL